MLKKERPNIDQYKILVTIGDINGIGLEAFIKALKKISGYKISNKIQFTIIGNTSLIDKYCKTLFQDVKVNSNKLIVNEISIELINLETQAELNFGKIDKEAGLLAKNALFTAVTLMQKSQFHSLITLPVSKEALKLAGWQFPGQTEMLAHCTHSKLPLMILCDKRIRLTLATIHTALKKVPQILSKQHLENIFTAFNIALERDFNITKPRIAVLGLNPHCGENSQFGDEEEKILQPTIDICKKKINIFGPFPADGFFAFNEYKNFDGIVAMYHDQGLIPLKLLTKGKAINFTAGLPFIRTSPDHGTAFSIAGKNIADEKSTLNAILLSIEILKSRIKFLQKNND